MSSSFTSNSTSPSSTSNPSPPSAATKPRDRETLLHAAALFCNAFSAYYSVDSLLAFFASDAPSSSSPSYPFAYEHGLPQLAPFLGRTFAGHAGVRNYFELLATHLTYSDMRFKDYVVDVDTLKVCTRGEARFTWKSNGQSWDEVFTYMLAFDDDLKVKTYEVWADSGAAYLANSGKLK